MFIFRLLQFLVKTLKVPAFMEWIIMKFYFIAIVRRKWAVNILIFLVPMLITGCGATSYSTSKILEIKPFEETMADYIKNLRWAKELTLETEISSKVTIFREPHNHDLKNFKAKLNILPISDSRQEISNLKIIPSGEIVDRSVEFKIDTLPPGRYEFMLRADAVLRNEFVQVSGKIPFPPQAVPTEQIKYTRPSLIIDSDDKKIHDLALSIAKGEDDLYRVVFKASKWVKENVQTFYDTSIVTTSQKASWVLENRKGVCDEKTNLFIGLLHSLGIPAKFITGFASTDYPDVMNHSPRFKKHAWAEVYFPSVGWIPFDVAYNQLGFIDATHIKLAESVDISNVLSSYEWQSSDAVVSIKDLEMRTDIKQSAGMIDPLLEIKSNVWYHKIDVESYNVIEATVINNHNFYVITDIHINMPLDLKLMDRNFKMLLMEPNTQKTIYWIVKPIINIDRKTRSVFPIEVVSDRRASSSLKFQVTKDRGYVKHSFEDLKNRVNGKIRDAL